MTAYLLERAWVDGAVRDDVLVTIEDGRFTDVLPESSAQPRGDHITLRTQLCRTPAASRASTRLPSPIR